MRIFRRRHEQDMAEEFRLHMEREVEAYQASGMPLEEARFAAARKFGNPGGLKEECRDVRQVALALGSGANTAIFTVAHAFLLRSLPVPNPDSLALIKVQRPKALLDGLVAADSYSFSYRLFDSLRLQQRSLFSSILATSSTEFVQKTSSGSRSIPGAFVSGEYFQVLQLKPQLGRLIAPADENSLLAVISDSFWSRAFGRDIHAIGRAVQLEGKAVSVVGILPSAFHGVMLGEDPDVFMPLGSEKILHAPFDLGCDDCEWLTVMARMKPNDTLPRLNASLSSVSKSTFANFPLGSMWGNTRDEVLKNKLGAISGRTGYTYLRRMFTRPLRVLMALAVLVVLMACANLASGAERGTPA